MPIEEPPEDKKGKRIVHENDGTDDEDTERVDMLAITGIKEKEERREKFYSVQQVCKKTCFFVDYVIYGRALIGNFRKSTDLRHFWTSLNQISLNYVIYG